MKQTVSIPPYTIRQLAQLAGVSVRTLHHYDQIGLLPAETRAANGYRRYGQPSLLRLQQILFYRELDFSLEQIKAFLAQPDFDPLQALRSHRRALQGRMQRLQRLVDTVDQTIAHLSGETIMKQEQFFAAFSDEKQAEYEQVIRQRYGDQAFKDVKDWKSYTPAQQAQIRAESEAIYHDLVPLLDADPASKPVQAIIARWHQHLRYFYEPSPERLLGLGQMYNQDPDFRATFDRIDPRLAPFMQQAIRIYCQK